MEKIKGSSVLQILISNKDRSLFKRSCKENGYTVSKMVRLFMNVINSKTFVIIDDRLQFVDPRIRSMDVCDIVKSYKKPELLPPPVEEDKKPDIKSVKKKVGFTLDSDD